MTRTEEIYRARALADAVSLAIRIPHITDPALNAAVTTFWADVTRAIDHLRAACDKREKEPDDASP